MDKKKENREIPGNSRKFRDCPYCGAQDSMISIYQDDTESRAGCKRCGRVVRYTRKKNGKSWQQVA